MGSVCARALGRGGPPVVGGSLAAVRESAGKLRRMNGVGRQRGDGGTGEGVMGVAGGVAVFTSLKSNSFTRCFVDRVSADVDHSIRLILGGQTRSVILLFSFCSGLLRPWMWFLACVGLSASLSVSGEGVIVFFCFVFKPDALAAEILDCRMTSSASLCFSFCL